MDRNTAVVPKQQLGFYNFIVRPMFDALDQFERSARALLDGMEELRAGAASVAEHAARQAVAELAARLAGG